MCRPEFQSIDDTHGSHAEEMFLLFLGLAQFLFRLVLLFFLIITFSFQLLIRENEILFLLFANTCIRVHEEIRLFLPGSLLKNPEFAETHSNFYSWKENERERKIKSENFEMKKTEIQFKDERSSGVKQPHGATGR